MNSDNYDFSKSAAPQSVSAYSPYTDKQWDFIQDNSSGSYSNNSGMSLVQFDLSGIFNSDAFSDASDLFLALPIVMCAAVGQTTGAAVTPPTAGYGLCSLKSNYQNLIHQIEIINSGKTVEQMVNFVNILQNFRMLSQMSAADLKCNGVSLGFSDQVDNEKSMVWNTYVNGPMVLVELD